MVVVIVWNRVRQEDKGVLIDTMNNFLINELVEIHCGKFN